MHEMQRRDSAKTCQSRLKEHVQIWAKCAGSWTGDVGAISALLDNLKRQLDVAASISKKMPPEGLLVGMTQPQDKSMQALNGHPSLRTRLLARITIEIETTLNMLKSYYKGLGDVFIAMQFAANDANQVLVQNQIRDVAGIVPILVETVLDIQRLQYQFQREYQRKKYLLTSLMQAEETDGNNNSSNSSDTTSRSLSRVVDESALRACMEQFETPEHVLFYEGDKLLLESIVEANTNAGAGKE